MEKLEEKKEILVNFFYGLNVIFQTENNLLNIKIYRFTANKMWGAAKLHSWTTHFLICIYDFSLVFKYLSSIMFADGTNLFYSYKNMEVLLENANDKLEKISQGFKVN